MEIAPRARYAHPKLGLAHISRTPAIVFPRLSRDMVSKLFPVAPPLESLQIVSGMLRPLPILLSEPMSMTRVDAEDALAINVGHKPA